MKQAPDKSDSGRTVSVAPRLYVTQAFTPEGRLVLPEAQGHYLTRVMRRKPGAKVCLFNGRDGEWQGRLVETSPTVSRQGCEIALERCLRPQGQSVPQDLWLLFAPLKKARLDYMAQKAAEMGVAALWPVRTAHTAVSRLNIRRLEANLVEAAEQCGLLYVPQVKPLTTLSTVLEGWNSARPIIFCDEHAKGAPLPRLQALSTASPPVTSLAVLTGPEGGFSGQEREMLRARTDTVVLSLGPRVMRADTAAVAALSAVQMVWGDWQGNGMTTS